MKISIDKTVVWLAWKMKNVPNELLDLTGEISRQNDKNVLAEHDTVQGKK